MSILNIIPALKAISPLTYSQYLFDQPGTYTWTCPPFCSSISVVCIGGGGGGGRDGAGGGGGGLAFVNNYSVTPGQTYTIVVGSGGTGGPTPTDGTDSSFNSAIIGGGGKAPVGALGGFGGTFTAPGGGGGYGGFGGSFIYSQTSPAGGPGQTGGGGGGAGGYGTNGGNGGAGQGNMGWGNAANGNGQAGTQGAGGGGGASISVYGNGNGTPSGGGGGGAGIFGSSASSGGSAGVGSADSGTAPTGGGGGTGGTKGDNGSANFLGGNAGGAGGLYGGGGGGSNGSGNGFGYIRGDTNNGGRGAVGIIIGNTIWGSYPTYYQSITGGAASDNGTSSRRIAAVPKGTTYGDGGATWTPNGYTSVQNASVDDTFLTLNLPFSIYYNGTLYSSIFIGSNFYITFGSGSSVFSGLGAGTPALNKIMLQAGDRSYQRVGYQTDNSTFFKVRFEGTAATSGTLGSPNFVYEITFFNPAYTPGNRTLIELIMGNMSATGGVTGLYTTTALLASFTLSGSSSFVFESTTSTATAFTVYGPGYSVRGY